MHASPTKLSKRECSFGRIATKEAHPGFVEKYFDLLKAGGSKHHSEMLAPFGLDARDPEFWNKGLKVLEGMIDELERMEAVG